jgi:hypothetical protein
LAPKLNCFAIKEIDTRDDGARTETEVVELARGTPSESLFAIPDDYVERSPKEMEALYKQKYNEGFYGGAGAQTLETRYQKLRSQ